MPIRPILRTLALATACLTPIAAKAQQVNGLYIAGLAGANLLGESSATLDPTTRNVLGLAGTGDARVNFRVGWAQTFSIGWGFGNGVRAEIEGTWRQNQVDDVRAFNVTSSGGRQRSFAVMANVFYEFTGLGHAQPYIGAGLGYAWIDWHNVRLATPSGALAVNDQDAQFAYQAMAGVAFPITAVPGLAVVGEFRFFGTLNPSYNLTVAPAGTGGLVTRQSVETENYNYSFIAGVRYNFGQRPPAPPPAAAPAPARSFLVFFDFGSDQLTARAREIVGQAATAARSQQVTRIEVAGHTDTVGSAQYNQGLSIRRANNVAAELVRQGVPREAITTAGFGFSRPLVPTGPNVREPQNRRVEIVLR